MGAHTPVSRDRLRMNWTPTMEQYFIDLLLDQVRKGNRMGHSFNKQAWADMMTAFNAKFGSNYDGDILKIQYTNLWKQFNDVKNLLEQNLFSWDDTRKIVMADHYTWDVYIKEHPGARVYRNRALTSFNDLCLIYAYTIADGRFSLSSHDIDFDDDIQGVNFGVGICSVAPASPAHSKTQWNPAMDRYFIELMLDQLNKGSNTFKKQAWGDMLNFFNTKFCLQLGKRILKRRYKKLLKYYSEIRSLLEQKGFSWDENQQIIVAEDGVWDKYIQAHPDARSYRRKKLLNYEELGLIYGNVVIDEGHMHQDRNFGNGILQIKIGEENNGNSSAGSDSLTTYWTPPMDDYFIDLLQYEALRGNKIRHTFVNEAWIGMVTLFNKKFGSQFGKDNLKSRYRHLRRQYNGIRILVGKKGFTWDEAREMVIAENYVWDSHTKANPDAQVYRNKSVPSYHKLCVIFGEECSNGRLSHMAYDEDLDSKGPLLMMVQHVCQTKFYCMYNGYEPGGEDTQCQPDDEYSRTYWTPSSDRYFIDLMLEEVRKGSKIDCMSNIQSWIDMALLVRERFGLPYDKDLLRSRHKHFQNLYYDMKNLFYWRGFSWDETRQLVAAYGDVWDAYFKEHPDTKSYIRKPGPNFNDLCLIYGNSNLGGKGNLLGLDIGCIGANQLNDSRQQRTANWTPSMDRFFINLMLEQIRQGNMVSQKFNKEAWGQMVAKLNAEFGSHYNRNDLKFCFINLKKQFIDMKVLIDQNEFYWDEMHQMITAYDDHWDLYLKEHPEARAYHNRTLPNYNDLFLIYGNANPNWKHYDSTLLTNGFEHAFGLNLDVDDECPSSRGHQRIQRWTKAMENYFIDLMLEQVQKGNRNCHTFKEQAWAWIITSFNEKFGLLLDKDILENQYVRLMKGYENITHLLNQPGFAWEEIQQVVIADDDTWKDYIEEHPDAIKYRDRNLAVYNDLCVIYDDTPSSRRSSFPDLETEIDNNALDVGINDIFQDLQDLVAEFEIPDCTKKRKSATSSTSASSTKAQRSKRKVLRKTRNANPHVGKPLVPKEDKDYGSIVTPSANPNVVKLLVPKEDKDCMPIETIVDAIQVLPGINDELFLEACKLLEDERKAKMFVAMDVDQRTKWLLKKLQRQFLRLH